MVNKRQYKSIIAITSVTVVALIVLCAPHMYDNNAAVTIQTSSEVKSKEPHVKAQQVKKSLELSDIADVYRNNSSREGKKKTIDEMGKSVEKVKKVIQDEVDAVKKESCSEEVKKSADEYELKTLVELNNISDKINALLEGYEKLSEDEVDRGIKDIAKAIDELCNKDKMDVNEEDDIHDSSDVSGIQSIEDIINGDPYLQYYFFYFPNELILEDSTVVERESRLEENSDEVADSKYVVVGDSVFEFGGDGVSEKISEEIDNLENPSEEDAISETMSSEEDNISETMPSEEDINSVSGSETVNSETVENGDSEN